jgi:4-amino-4-deoxy-L-arabinose transferase-like glycosyltransferase
MLAVSGLLKIVLAVVFADLAHHYDAKQFLQNADAVYRGLGDPLLFRAPGYQWFLVTVLRLSGGHTVAIYLLQALLSTAACVLVYRIGRRWSERAGFWAGTFVAFHPTQVAFAHWPWAETLFAFLVLVALERLLVADERGSRAAALVAGLALGAASLTRSSGLAWLVLSLAWLAWPRRHGRGMALVAAVAIPALLMIAPWSMAASKRAGCTVLIDTNGGYNLWSGNNRYVPDDLQGIWALGIPLHNGLDPRLAAPRPDDGWRREVLFHMGSDGLSVADRLECRGSAWYRGEALDEIRRDPGSALARLPRKLAAFWSPDIFLPRALLRDWYGATPPWLAALLTGLTWAFAGVALLLGPAALAALRPQRFRSLVILWLGAYLAAHIVFFGASRMHFPLTPMLALAVAGLLWDPSHPIDWRSALRRGGVWVVLALAVWVYGAAAMVGLYLSPAPAHAGTARVLALARHLPVPASQRPAWMLAEIEASLGRVDVADAILREPGTADYPWSLYLRGRIETDPQRALALLEEALVHDPELFAAWWAAAGLHVEAARWSEAEEAFVQALTLRPWDQDVRDGLTRVLQQLGEDGGARESR